MGKNRMQLHIDGQVATLNHVFAGAIFSGRSGRRTASLPISPAPAGGPSEPGLKSA